LSSDIAEVARRSVVVWAGVVSAASNARCDTVIPPEALSSQGDSWKWVGKIEVEGRIEVDSVVVRIEWRRLSAASPDRRSSNILESDTVRLGKSLSVREIEEDGPLAIPRCCDALLSRRCRHTGGAGNGRTSIRAA